MIKDKYKTFLRALEYSYQSAEIKKENENQYHQVLINSERNCIDYDDKMLSADFNLQIKCGDILHWKNTDTYWIVYSREFTEDAYFRGNIRRCKYLLYWIDMEKKAGERKHSTYAYIKGPVETKIKTSEDSHLLIDIPNNTLQIFISKNEFTAKYFYRYQRFAFNNLIWKIQVVDDISIEGVIEIIALEDYENQEFDDSKKEKVTEAFYIAPTVEESDGSIIGPSSIKPLGIFSYQVKESLEDGAWYIEEKNRPIDFVKVRKDSVEVKWNSSHSGNFTLLYGNQNKVLHRKNVIVESLF